MEEKAAEREGTLRERIREALRAEEKTARDLSQLLRETERVILDAIPHVERTVKASGGRLVVAPSECAGCGFVFDKRERVGKPSRCPKCRATRVTPPRFKVVEKA
ncbi:MAG TPA: transcriptional regulator [Thermoanaerobaculia bacterium]|nr:transcriptional regulator [Thermoanaerobaculia bacterium]